MRAFILTWYKDVSIKRLFLSAVLFLSFASPCGAGELSIPLTVHEALRRQGVSGIDRATEPVTVGIPFPKGMLHEKNGVPRLALKEAKEYQFRTLAAWPDGSVKWALIDFQTDIKAGKANQGITVTSGEGNSAGRLAEEREGFIDVDTGAMVARIRKKGFNLFDRVTIGGKEIITEGSRGIVLTDGKGRQFFASNDPEVRIVIEENGPLRAVIKAEGSHTGEGQKLLEYTVRMHFYKGKSRAKVIYTLRNASKNRVEHAYIKSLDLITKTGAALNPAVTIANHTGTLEERLSKGEDRLVYYQAVSDFPQEYAGGSFYWHAPIPADSKRKGVRGFVQEGYRIWRNDRLLSDGKRGEYPDLAFMDVKGERGEGVTAGIRFAAGWWPKSLSAYGDGTLEVGLWPRENEVGYWIRYGSHNTFEVLYEFHSREADPAGSMKRFQYPLVAKAPVEWYNRNVEGIYPLYHFVSFKDEREYVSKKGWEDSVGKRNPGMKIWRYHYWGWGGFLNQHDFARISLVNFLRETENYLKAGKYYLLAEARFGYNADWAIPHSDDYDLTQSDPQPKANKEKAGLAKVIFEIEHPHWYGLPLYYYVTGDERIREAILDWGETVRDRARMQHTMGYERFFGWEMYSLAALYGFTGDQSYMELADDLFQRLLSARYNEKKPWKSIVMDWNRGFIRKGNKGFNPGLMVGYILFDGIYNYYLHLEEGNPLKEKAADMLEGLSEFMYREPYFEETKKNHWALWLPYIYFPDDKSKSNHEYRLIREAFYVHLFPYLHNGDYRRTELMDKIIRMSAWDGDGVWEGFGYMDHPGLQSLLYYRLYPVKEETPPPVVTDLTAVAKGMDVVLRWTAPAGSLRYQIKYSSKKLVQSLEFDPEKRVYRYEPTEYANWWAGENISDEPLPGAAGTMQTMTVKGLKPGRYYVALRSWGESNSRSGISNLAEVEVP